MSAARACLSGGWRERMSRQSKSGDDTARTVPRGVSGMMRSVMTRFALLAVALLSLGWLGVLYRDHRIVDDVSPGLIGDSSLVGREFESEARRLERAELLNPDPTWRLNLGLALLERSPRRAVCALERVVESEPDNVAAWKVLHVAARRVDPPLAARASAEVKRLDPLTEF